MNDHYPFELPPLPYPYDALEPYLSAQTIQLHYEKHFNAYVDNLNRTLEHYPAYHNWSLERLITENCRLPFQIQTAVWHNAGGVYNHGLYFGGLTPCGENTPEPAGRLREAILSCYGSEKSFFERLKECSMAQFGSGWGWLACDRRGKLKIINLPNQDTPLACGLFPVVALDVWEHAYYLQYQNRKEEYIDNYFHVMNFETAAQNYINCISFRQNFRK